MSHRRNKNLFPILVALIVFASLGGALFRYRGDLSAMYFRYQQGPVPAPVGRSAFIAQQLEDALEETVPEVAQEEAPPEHVPDIYVPPTPTPTTSRENILAGELEIPKVLNLYVPFVSQAPFGTWEHINDEACEEASLIMLNAYMNDIPSVSPEKADEEILGLVAHQMETLGYFESTDAEQTATLMKEFYDFENVAVVPINSIEDVKVEIAKGYPVILPAHGKTLGNPFFSGDGPEYHMLIAKGYTETHIISHDPGTKRGADFLYEPDALWDSIHDWNDGDVLNGAKVMIVVR